MSLKKSLLKFMFPYHMETMPARFGWSVDFSYLLKEPAHFGNCESPLDTEFPGNMYSTVVFRCGCNRKS